MLTNNTIVRATITSSAELGLFSSALLLLRTCCCLGADVVYQTVRDCGKELPLFDALVRRGIHPDRIVVWLSDLVSELDAFITDEIDTILCTAMEAVFIDHLANYYPDHNIVVVNHDPDANKDRIEANYNNNFQLADLSGIDTFANPLTTLLIVPVFDAGSDKIVTTYPNTNRIIGDDTPLLFAETVAVDLLGSSFHFFPTDMAQVPINKFTHFIHLPVYGRKSIAV